MLVQVCPKGDTSRQGKVIDHFHCYGNGTVWCFFLYKVMNPTGSSSHYICFFSESAGSLFLSNNWWNIKQLLDEVLLTETLIIPVLQKPNLVIALLYIVYKKITTNRPSHWTQFEMLYARNLQIIH